MPGIDITDEIRHFVFEHVDSVGQLDTLLYLRERRDVYHNAESLSRELRTNASAAASYLSAINNINLLIEDAQNKGSYQYQPPSDRLEQTVARLAEVYKIKPHKILEIIFSPAKRARLFANAFALTRNPKPEDDHG